MGPEVDIPLESAAGFSVFPPFFDGRVLMRELDQ
jgi:hypothetical protein